VFETPQEETAPFYPRCFDVVARRYACWVTVNFYEANAMYACNGILFSHESPCRGETFVTRKIMPGLANISQGLEDFLCMGKIDALRDWVHVKDCACMQWMMMQQDQPQYFVIANGVQYSVRQFIEWTVAVLGMNLRGEGDGANEVGYATNPRTTAEKPIARIGPRYFNPTKVETLLGDPTSLSKNSAGNPKDQWIEEMAASDLAEGTKHALLKKYGYDVSVICE
jgi:GDPmannose 4,6-dehydratase